jgi:hypothetical protein
MPLHLVEEDLEAGRLVQPKTEGGDEWTYHPEWVHLKSRPLGRAGLGVAQGVENSMKAPRTAGL